MRENARQILEIINNSDEHLTAEQVYLRLKENNSKAVLATVYNNLASLYQKGLIRKVAVAGFPDRYDKWKCAMIISYVNNAVLLPISC